MWTITYLQSIMLVTPNAHFVEIIFLNLGLPVQLLAIVLNAHSLRVLEVASLQEEQL